MTKVLIALLALPIAASEAKPAKDTKTVDVRGKSARAIMEALAAAGVPMKGADNGFGAAPITIAANRLDRDYSAGTFPDEWMTDVACEIDYGLPTMTELKQPLAVIHALEPYAGIYAHTGSRSLYLVKSLSCALDYSTKAYSCTLEVRTEWGTGD